MEKRQQRRLFRPQVRYVGFQLLLDLCLISATDRRRGRRRTPPDGHSTCGRSAAVLPRRCRDPLDRRADVLLGLRLAVDRLELAQSASAASTVPAQVRKSLAVKSRAGDLAQIVVDVGGVDRPPLAVLVDVLEQLLAGQVLALLRRSRASRAVVARRCCARLPLLPRNVEVQLASRRLDVAVAQRREAEGLVLLARTPRCRRGSASSRAGARRWRAPSRAAGRAAPGRASTRARMRGSASREGDHALVLRLVAHLAPARVIAVLLAAARVAPRGLDVPAASGQIQTSVQAGGIASERMRFSAASRG